MVAFDPNFPAHVFLDHHPAQHEEKNSVCESEDQRRNQEGREIAGTSGPWRCLSLRRLVIPMSLAGRESPMNHPTAGTAFSPRAVRKARSMGEVRIKN